MECGNEHYAKTFDKIEDFLDKRRDSEEQLLHIINTRTKAAIIHIILGLGHIFRQQGHEYLSDMPDIINLLETELRNFNTEDFIHKNRGQHPEPRSDQQETEDNDIMTEDRT
eukprot:16435854-Heterocapsa_arctica.AAC.1